MFICNKMHVMFICNKLQVYDLSKPDFYDFAFFYVKCKNGATGPWTVLRNHATSWAPGICPATVL
jgi:hypothetical protein